jgi:hypothetical protein
VRKLLIVIVCLALLLVLFAVPVSAAKPTGGNVTNIEVQGKWNNTGVSVAGKGNVSNVDVKGKKNLTMVMVFGDCNVSNVDVRGEGNFTGALVTGGNCHPAYEKQGGHEKQGKDEGRGGKDEGRGGKERRGDSWDKGESQGHEQSWGRGD